MLWNGHLGALIGIEAIRTHGAERSVRREHEGILVEWSRASRALLRTVVSIEGLNLLLAYGLAAALLVGHLSRVDAPAVVVGIA